MIEDAKQWEGQLLGGRFRLGRLLGGSERSAVFRVEEGAGGQAPTVIRLVDANTAAADEQLKQWEAASKLSHPNLIRIIEAGRCQLAGRDFVYVISECAEENLAQILPERALTAEEARQALEAVLAALAHIHGQGLVHGNLRPSNIFAVGDTVKVSSDTLYPAGQSLAGRSANPWYDAPELLSERLAPPADVWSLGVTLTEVLTQQVPQFDSHQKMQQHFQWGIPQPFHEIVENCLQPDPARRWSVAQIADYLGGERRDAVRPAVAQPVPQRGPRESPIEPGEPRPAKWPYAIALVAAVVVAVVLLTRPKPPAPPPAEKPASNEASAATSPPAVSAAGQVAERVKPQVSTGALHTIQGRIRVQVEVNVDEKGRVTGARLKTSGPSRYFAGRALEAAKGWKFRPPVENGQPVASQWLVRFTFRPRAVEDSAEQIKP